MSSARPRFANVDKQRVFKIYRDAVFDTLVVNSSLTVLGDLLLNGPPIVGATGATGPQGGAGVTGAVGASGLAGGAGDAGGIGQTGATGQTGLDGATGATGSIGTAGAVGDAGVTGPSGATGPVAPGQQGPMGAGGPAGEQAGVFEFSSGTIFEDNGSGTPTPASIPVTLNTTSLSVADVLFIGKGFSYIKRNATISGPTSIDISGLPVFSFVVPKPFTITRTSATVHDIDATDVRLVALSMTSPTTPDSTNRVFTIATAVPVDGGPGTVSGTNTIPIFSTAIVDTQLLLAVISASTSVTFTGVSAGLDYTSP